MNWKSIVVLITGTTLFLAFADNLAFLYDSIMDEDYSGGVAFESGGEVNVIIYLIAIVGFLIFTKKAKNPHDFVVFALTTFAAALYFGRFLSTQMYERISYFFTYFLMLGFPLMFRDMAKKDRMLFRTCFIILCIALFAYRISKGAFADFALIL